MDLHKDWTVLFGEEQMVYYLPGKQIYKLQTIFYLLQDMITTLML